MTTVEITQSVHKGGVIFAEWLINFDPGLLHSVHVSTCSVAHLLSVQVPVDAHSNEELQFFCFVF